MQSQERLCFSAFGLFIAQFTPSIADNSGDYTPNGSTYQGNEHNIGSSLSNVPSADYSTYFGEATLGEYAPATGADDTYGVPDDDSDDDDGKVGVGDLNVINDRIEPGQIGGEAKNDEDSEAERKEVCLTCLLILEILFLMLPMHMTATYVVETTPRSSR